MTFLWPTFAHCFLPHHGDLLFRFGFLHADVKPPSTAALVSGRQGFQAGEVRLRSLASAVLFYERLGYERREDEAFG